jgi:hypothetical protein
MLSNSLSTKASVRDGVFVNGEIRRVVILV